MTSGADTSEIRSATGDCEPRNYTPGGFTVDGLVPERPRVSDEHLAGTIDAARSAIAAVVAEDRTRLAPSDLVTLYRELDSLGRLLTGAGHLVLSEMMAADALRDHPHTTRNALADLVHITAREAGRRLRHADLIAPGRAMTGQPLAPVLEHTARGVADGTISPANLTVIVDFFGHLPANTDPTVRAEAEEALAYYAAALPPEHLRTLGVRLLQRIDADGPEPIIGPDPARKRFFRMGEQGPDGFTTGSFCIDAELRAYLESVLAKYARPGSGPARREAEPTDTDTDTDTDTEPTDTEPTDTEPTDTDTEPTDTERDERSTGQRAHDAVKLVFAEVIASGALGRHRGAPVIPIVIMTLADLERSAGLALTAAGSSISIPDALRMAGAAHPYLAVLDHQESPLYLGRTKRIASLDQRLALYATERGCTFPGCTRPATDTEVHHRTEWARGGTTDIDELTLACLRHHSIIGDGESAWATSVAPPGHPFAGRTLWHPPAALDPARAGRINHVHHPDELLP